MATASLTFLPWVRQGVAAAITTVDTLGAGQHGVVDLSAALSINRSPTPPVPVRLRGPADVVGIDANQVVRMDPQPGTSDFEPTYFPCVEFDRPDFPWLFTPARANPDGKLRPWLCLVVVRKQNGVTLGSGVDAPLPTLRVTTPAQPNVELPDLGECWAWAHAQAASVDRSRLPAALEGSPELALSRLICPRILAPETDYLACVVPTFELGRKAGLGRAIADSDLVAPTALGPAWSLSPAPREVLLPVYHHWEFRTGVGGNFASLVSQLRPAPAPSELGRRPIDINKPGFFLPPAAQLPPGTTLKVEGALRPVPPANTPDVMPPWPESAAKPFQETLAAIVNAPGRSDVANPQAPPLLAPPLYGRCYAARPTVTRTGADWFDQLNLDPRLRCVTAFGTHVVQQHQEALMASAWEQAGDLQRANQFMRQLQMSLVVGNRLFARHFAPLSNEAALLLNGPVLSRVNPSATGHPQSMLAQIRSNGIPAPALSPAMRRMGRQRGPFTRRAAARGLSRSATWVASLRAGTAALPTLTWFDLVTVMAVAQHMSPPAAVLGYSAVKNQVIVDRGGAPWFVVRPEGRPISIADSSFTYGSASYDSPSARAFRGAAAEHLARITPERTGSIGRQTPVPMDHIRTGLSREIRPQQTVAALARGAISVGVAARQRLRGAAASAATTGTAIDTIMLPPTFPQPMYEALRDLSQALMLPGLDAVKPDRVLGLRTNRRFVEAYLVGLNVEMGRELLWRGYPTDQRGTYFDNFWGGGPDITALHLWGERPLGDVPSLPPREKFVMLLRSPLLRRYPNAVIYLTPAVLTQGRRVPSEAPEAEKLPVFAGSMPPDINFVGFDLTAEDVVGGSGHGSGYYLVIQQHPTEPRFGLHTGVSAGTASHLRVSAGAPAGQPLNGLTWGLNAAHMAGILRSLPVRLAIHASQFQTPSAADQHP
jgi:hypothetical protein